MIAADVLSSDDPEVQRDAKIFINPNEIEAEDSFVTYDLFVRTYWPHFPRPLPKGLGMCCLVDEYIMTSCLHYRTMACLLRVYGCVASIKVDLEFSDFIIGVIKGSEKALTCPGGFLDEATYCGLSARSNPRFANHRQTLYGLFGAYCKLKKDRRHHDTADRTRVILKALLGGTPLDGRRVDYL